MVRLLASLIRPTSCSYSPPGLASSCLLYDHWQMGANMALVSLAFRLASLLMYTLALAASNRSTTGQQGADPVPPNTN